MAYKHYVVRHKADSFEKDTCVTWELHAVERDLNGDFRDAFGACLFVRTCLVRGAPMCSHERIEDRTDTAKTVCHEPVSVIIIGAQTVGKMRALQNGENYSMHVKQLQVLLNHNIPLCTQ